MASGSPVEAKNSLMRQEISNEQWLPIGTTEEI